MNNKKEKSQEVLGEATENIAGIAASSFLNSANNYRRTIGMSPERVALARKISANILGNQIDKNAYKAVPQVLGLRKAGPLVGSAFVASDLYDGWNDAGRRFNVEEPTWGMKAASAAADASNGILFGYGDPDKDAVVAHKYWSDLARGGTSAERQANIIKARKLKKETK